MTCSSAKKRVDALAPPAVAETSLSRNSSLP